MARTWVSILTYASPDQRCALGGFTAGTAAAMANMIPAGVGMNEAFRQAALTYHRLPRPGKLLVEPTKRMETQRDLALAYSPGVAAPCLEIAADPDTAR